MRKLCTLTILLFWVASSAGAASIDGRLAYLASTTGKAADNFTGSLRFHTRPSAAQLRELADLGVEFFDQHGRTVYPARIPFSGLPALQDRADIASIECGWHPVSVPSLARSAIEVEADQVWEIASPAGGTVTGKGVLICDIDTGVNYFHSSFFKLDGEVFTWLDVDNSGDLSSRDAVDLNSNGRADPGEKLRWKEAIGTARFGNVLGVFDADLDILFNDTDNNEIRDYGPPRFGEDSPCYGERLFLCDDLNADGRLNVGEPLLSLGDTRIRAIREGNGEVHRRGIDLFASEGDYWGHGTPVSGILAGGWARRHRMTGMAPGAEMLHVIQTDADEPPFGLPITPGLAWAVAEGADVVLFEFGMWVWEYLDGSSNLEIMINEYAEDEGVIFVNGVGNLATGQMHSRFRSAGGQVLSLEAATTIVWASFLWTDTKSLGLTVAPPAGQAIRLSLDGTTVVANGYRIYSNLSVSPRGTRRIDLRLGTDPEGAGVGGDWRFTFHGSDADVHGYFADNDLSWVSPSKWIIGEDPTHTISWPATADSSIGVAAYYTFNGGPISPYSSRGPRIDGRPIVDIAAPGSSVTSANPDNPTGFIPFGATSGAGAHVAGAAALLAELAPGLDHGVCRQYLRMGAAQDEFTGDPHRAGAGKLRIRQTIAKLLGEMSESPMQPSVTVVTFPNPCNTGATIRYRQVASGSASLRVFDAGGREIWNMLIQGGVEEWRDVRWNGKDRDGRTMAAGVYFAHVRQGEAVGACKLTIVK